MTNTRKNPSEVRNPDEPERPATALGTDPIAEIDLNALARWMDATGLAGTGEHPELSVLSGGASNVLLEIRRGGQRMALRKPPSNIAGDRNPIMMREYRILRALGTTDIAHPRVFGACDDPGVAGAWFYVTELVDGWSIMQTKSWPPPFDTDMRARRGLAFELIRGIAELARIDWRAIGLEGLGRPDGFHERQADRWLAHLAPHMFREIPGLDEAASWLRTHQPRHYEPGIMHGDYQFANVMFRHGAPARLAAIIDWEMGTIGDPLLDLAWVLMGWPDPGEDRTGGYADYTSMPSRQELIEYYRKISGRPVADIDYYIVLARFKMAAVLEPSYARWVAGRSTIDAHEAFGDVVLDMAARAASLAALLD